MFHTSQTVFSTHDIYIWKGGRRQLIIPGGSRGIVRGVAQNDYYHIDWLTLHEGMISIHMSCLTSTPPAP